MTSLNEKGEEVAWNNGAIAGIQYGWSENAWTTHSIWCERVMMGMVFTLPIVPYTKSALKYLYKGEITKEPDKSKASRLTMGQKNRGQRQAPRRLPIPSNDRGAQPRRDGYSQQPWRAPRNIEDYRTPRDVLSRASGSLYPGM